MIVTCQSVEEFLICLAAEYVGIPEDQSILFGETIRCNASKRDSEGDHAAFDVSIQVAAIVCTAEGQYLLQAAERCGVDYSDGQPDSDPGTVRFNQLKTQIEAFARLHDLKILPGAIAL